MKDLFQRQFQIVAMINPKIKQLMDSIRSKAYSDSAWAKGDLGAPEATSKLKLVSQEYDQLLQQCTTMMDLLNESIFQSSEEYHSLMEQLDREKKDKLAEMDELQKNIHISDCKLAELRDVIGEKEEEIFHLKNQLQEKEAYICQFQAETRESIARIINNNEAKMLDNFEMEKIHLREHSEKIIQKLQQENQQYLQENELLSSRLEEIMKHLQTNQKEESVCSQRQGQIVSQYMESTNKKMRSPISPFNNPASILGSAQRSCQLSVKDDHDSSKSCSSNRMILREILNTQDRNDNNFNEINFYSKDRLHLLASNDENWNQLNVASKVEDKSGCEQIQVIQEFKTEEKEVHTCPDPYYIFFTLISQCAKIDSQNMEAAALVDLSSQWAHFTSQKVPLHEWYSILMSRISGKVATL